jgi:hypothetical protein
LKRGFTGVVTGEGLSSQIDQQQAQQNSDQKHSNARTSILYNKIATKPLCVALSEEVHELLERVGVPVRDYYPIVKLVYTSLREDFDRQLEKYTQQLNAEAAALTLQVSARGTIDDQALADINAITLSRDASIKQVDRALDTRRWEIYYGVLNELKMAATFAYKHDAASVAQVITSSGYGLDGFTMVTEPWDAKMYAMLMRLYKIAQQ